MNLLLTVSILSIVVFKFTEAQECAFILNDLQVDSSKDKVPSPLFLKPGRSEFFHPNDVKTYMQIKLKKNEQIELFCDEFEGGIFPDKTQRVLLKCVSGKEFSYDNIPKIDITKLSCKNWIEKSIRDTGTNCGPKGGNGKMFEVGFNVDKRWLKIYSICLNTIKKIPIFSEVELTPFLKGNENKVKQPFFSQESILDGFFSKPVFQIYQEKRDLFNKIFGIADDMTKGHLAPMDHFMTANEQRASYTFANVIPQFASNNNRNWKNIEESVKKYAAPGVVKGRELHNLRTITGSIGVIKSPQGNEIYLDESKKGLPVPKLIYKIVLDEKDKKAVVFLTVNNQYLNKSQLISEGYFVCDDISEEMSQCKKSAKCDRDKQVWGISYACKLSNFLQKIPDAASRIVNPEKYELLKFDVL